MNRYHLIFLVAAVCMLLGGTRHTHASNYDVARISPELMKGSGAVIREHHTTFKVLSESRARVSVRQVITIMEKRMEGLADIRINYDPGMRVIKVSGTIYDAQGKKVRDLKKDEFTDVSAGGSFSLYADNRIIYSDIYRSQFPFTVAFEYELEYRSGFFFNYWLPQFTTDLSVEKSSHSIEVPQGFEFRYRSYNSENLEPEIQNQPGSKVYTWRVENMPGIKFEPYMPGLSKVAPYVRFGSNQFSYHNSTGDISSWQYYGHWINGLNEGRQQIPLETSVRVKQLIEGMDDPIEKVRAIYTFMQSRTRYVSIQLGLGGFQPFDAVTVDQTGYGDCKALANYTRALLQVAGIESHYTLIYNGTPLLLLDPEFPDKAFNHVILCVPLENDTLWLETTNNQIPMGYIGANNANRHVLVVTPQGGKLTQTPYYAHDQNKRTRSLEVSFSNPGNNIELSARNVYTGLRISERFGYLFQGETLRRRNYIESLSLNNPQVQNFSLTLTPGLLPSIEEQAQLSCQYITRAGNRILFQPNILGKLNDVPALVQDRRHPVDLQRSPLMEDTVRWNLPAGYEITHLPKDVLIENDFGYYQASYIVEENFIILARKFFNKKGLHPAERYQEVVDFYREVYNSDRAQVVISLKG